MSAATAEEPMVCAELWLSFGSLVRAYTAAASLDVDPAPQVEIKGETICLTAGSARLAMNCDSKTGAGSWQLTSAETVVRQGQLQLLPEGRIELDGKTLDLDHAAIDLVAAVMNAAANPARGAR